MLHHGSNGDRCHNKNCGNVKFADLERRKSYPVLQMRQKQNLRMAEPSGLVIPQQVHNHCDCIRNYNTHEDRDDLKHAFSPDVEDNDHGKSDQMLRNQLVEAFEIALGARLKPIQMMIGPVTTGGKKRITRFTPANLMISAKTKIKKSCNYDSTAGIW